MFFSGCNLRCVFCQNREISDGDFGKTLSIPELAEVFKRLEDSGVHNIALVTANHFAGAVISALEIAKPSIPVVWNSSGYDSVETLKKLEGYVSVYMPDLKYLSGEIAKRYSGAKDYPGVALDAIDEMYRQRGDCVFDDEGIMRSGVLIRHLMLPGCVEDTLDVIDAVSERFPKSGVAFSLMSQYTPAGELSRYPEIMRTVSRDEYERAQSYLLLSGLDLGYLQELESATEDFIPEFNLIGL